MIPCPGELQIEVLNRVIQFSIASGFIQNPTTYNLWQDIRRRKTASNSAHRWRFRSPAGEIACSPRHSPPSYTFVSYVLELTGAYEFHFVVERDLSVEIAGRNSWPFSRQNERPQWFCSRLFTARLWSHRVVTTYIHVTIASVEVFLFGLLRIPIQSNLANCRNSEDVTGKNTTIVQSASEFRIVLCNAGLGEAVIYHCAIQQIYESSQFHFFSFFFNSSYYLYTSNILL